MTRNPVFNRWRRRCDTCRWKRNRIKNDEIRMPKGLNAGRPGRDKKKRCVWLAVFADLTIRSVNELPFGEPKLCSGRDLNLIRHEGRVKFVGTTLSKLSWSRTSWLPVSRSDFDSDFPTKELLLMCWPMATNVCFLPCSQPTKPNFRKASYSRSSRQRRQVMKCDEMFVSS